METESEVRHSIRQVVPETGLQVLCYIRAEALPQRAEPEMQIVSRCKIYGYDFSAVDHVIGDYYMGEHTTDEMAHVLIDYLQEKDPALYEEIKEYDLFVG